MHLLYSFHTRETFMTMIEYSMSMFTQLLGPPVLRSRPALPTLGRLGIAESEINILKFPSQKEKYVSVLSKRLVLFI